MYARNYCQIRLLAFLAAVSGSMGLEIPGKQRNYIQLSGQKECEFPDFPDYGQTYNVTFADNSTLTFESDAKLIPDDKQVIEFCRSGWWVSYDDFNYKTWYGDWFGEDLNFYFGLDAHPMSPTCGKPSEYFHTRQIRSARRIGFTDGSPSATIFSDTYYGGERTVFKIDTDIPVLPYEVKSLAVLNTGILFFEEENFQGRSDYGASSGCSYIACGEEIVYYLCHNNDLPGSAYPIPFTPKSAKIVNQGLPM